MTPIERIQSRLDPLRTKLLEHPVYRQIETIEALHIFMQHHVFAVWDFMSLLKSLQGAVCGVGIPWLPPIDQSAARLINEIVLAEESDDDGGGQFASHFDLYHRAMIRCGADTHQIDRFLKHIRQGESVESAITGSEASPSVQGFVRTTFDIIDSGDLCAIASAFTFGREDLLPGVFQRIVDELNDKLSGGLDDFRYYLHRHIELDGDQHGEMAAQLLTTFCGDDEAKWKKAEESAMRSLNARITMWDGILEAILSPITTIG